MIDHDPSTVPEWVTVVVVAVVSGVLLGGVWIYIAGLRAELRTVKQMAEMWRRLYMSSRRAAEPTPARPARPISTKERRRWKLVNLAKNTDNPHEAQLASDLAARLRRS